MLQRVPAEPTATRAVPVERSQSIVHLRDTNAEYEVTLHKL